MVWAVLSFTLRTAFSGILCDRRMNAHSHTIMFVDEEFAYPSISSVMEYKRLALAPSRMIC